MHYLEYFLYHTRCQEFPRTPKSLPAYRKNYGMITTYPVCSGHKRRYNEWHIEWVVYHTAENKPVIENKDITLPNAKCTTTDHQFLLPDPTFLVIVACTTQMYI